MNDRDIEFLQRAIEYSKRSRNHGNEPFGAVLVDSNENLLLEIENTEITENDITGHAETNLARQAYRSFSSGTLEQSTIYSSCEPCPMCSGAIFWSGIGRLVYGLSKESLLELKQGAVRAHSLSCRDVLDGCDVEVVGPALQEEAARPHEGFWNA